MGELLRAMLKGAGAVIGVYFILLLLLRGCVAIVDAHEPVEAQGVYEVFGVRGRPFIEEGIYDRDPLYPYLYMQDRESVIEVIDSGQGASNYISCNADQKFYRYVIQRLRLRADTPPGFWDNTIKKYTAVLKECHL